MSGPAGKSMRCHCSKRLFRWSIFLLCLVLVPLIRASLLFGQTTVLPDQLQSALQARDEKAYLALVSTDPRAQSQEKEFIQDLLAYPYKKAVLKLASEQENKLTLHVFLEAEEESKFQAWQIETTSEGEHTLIRHHEVVSQVTGLYRLRLDPLRIEVRDLVFHHQDATFRLTQGSLFFLHAGDEFVGVVFMGKGIFEFSPADATEQQQLTLFCKQQRLSTSIEYFYLRTTAQNMEEFFGKTLSSAAGAESPLYSRADSIARETNPAVGSVTVPLSDELWYTQFQHGEVYCQLKSSLGTLVYQYSPGDREDVLLTQKDRDRIICFYNSSGIRSSTPPPEDYQILSYVMRIHSSPLASYLSAVAKVRLLSQKATSTIVFKLNGSLRVSQVLGSQGSLLYFQEKKSDNLHLVLNEPLEPGTEITLEFYYQGTLQSEQARSEAQVIREPPETEIFIPHSYLYSNHARWYPQLPSRPYCQAETSISVPSNYTAISNGRLVKTETKGERTIYTYKMNVPVRYFSLLIGQLDGHFAFDSIVPLDVYYYSIDKNTAEQYAKTADTILRFYSNYFGVYPYQNLTLVLRPFQEPGGHSPATIAIVNRIFTFQQVRLKRDPLYIPEFPTFVLAHEIAHQWWGQAVGWRNYQDQWLSEGFAQFAAWEYIRAEQGEKGWNQLARLFSDWVEHKSHAGPITLGARLGHLIDDPKAFSAVIYNKGAYVLNMLKNWMGAENFSRTLSDFYMQYRFQLADIDEFCKTAQQHTGEDLQPFFQQWLYRWDFPSVIWSETREWKDSQPVLKLRFTQREQNLYQLKVPVEIKDRSGNVFRAQALLDQPVTEVELVLPFEPDIIEIDPLHENLMNPQRQ